MATPEEARKLIREEIAQGNLRGFEKAPQETQDVLRSYGQAPITSASLAPVPTPTIPQPTPDTTNYDSIIAGGQGVIGANQPASTSAEPTDDLSKRIADLTASIGTPPPSVEGAYQSAYQTSGVDTAQRAATAQQARVKQAQAKLAGVQAQIQSVVNKRDVQNLQLEKQASGGQVVTTVLNRQQQEINRQAAIEALPLQALALAAQAEVIAEQGQAEFAQSTLKIAQDKLDTAFKLKSQDIKNEYDFKKDAREKIYDFLTDEQKRRADAKQKAEDREYQTIRDQINNAQALSKQAMDAGQPDLAAKITALDPNSPSYVLDLAELQGQIKSKVETKAPETREVGGKLYQFDTTTKTWKPAPGIPTTGVTPGIQLSPQGVPIDAKTGKPMSLAENDKKLLDAFNKIDNTINQLEQVYNRASTGLTAAPLARLFGKAKQLGQKVGLAGPAIREYEALVNASVGPIARAVLGEVGVLTDKDVERAKNALPSLTDTPEESRRKITNMRQIVAENRGDFFARLGVEGQTQQRPEDLRTKYNY